MDDEFIGRVLPVLEWVHAQVAAFDHSRGVTASANYEQMYFALVQVHDSLTGEFENPALAPFIAELDSFIAPLLAHRDRDTVESWTMPRLVEEACHYIVDIVWRTVEARAQDPSQLGCLVDAAKSEGPLDVATLNYDCLIERALTAAGIPFADGFGATANGWRPWVQGSLAADNTTRVLKLHGSFGWYWFLDDDNREFYPFGSVPDGAAYDARNASGKRMLPLDPRPALLAGTHNKLQQYSMTEIHTVLHCQWYAGLKRAQNLVVSGYSFGDKAINSRLADWVNPRKHGRMIVICRNEARLIASARGVIRRQWREWRATDRVRCIELPFEKAQWSVVERLIS